MEDPDPQVMETPTETIPEPDEETVLKDDRSGLLKLLGKTLDITTVAIPVTYNEPLSFIQRMAEYLQYWELVEKANRVEDPDMRLLYVTLFATSLLSASERLSKPFNPLLGETFEFYDSTKDYKFIAEQVSHHPPIGAAHASSPAGTFWQTQGVKTKFSPPNSLEVKPYGPYSLKLNSKGDVYHWENLTTIVHNLIFGKMWLDHFGDLEVTCEGSNRVAKVCFKQCGWFGKNWKEVEGSVFGEDGSLMYSLNGKWNESVYVTKLDNTLNKKDRKNLAKKALKERKKKEKQGSKSERDTPTTPLPEPIVSDSDDFEFGKPRCLWRNYNIETIDPTSRVASKWKLTRYSLKLIELTDELRAILPPTDSRLRADRLALEAGDPKKAAAEKYKLEEEQRARRRQRETQKIIYSPKYFKKVSDDKDEWIFLGNYWKEREERMKSKKS
eukprot:TRINITY_DN719_c0_g10_i1.p1 TRINITY_DN719_c0_g10~~TRINITY_DN719_c0_g10_i1.p1  ORF type:complete len:463 (-),score=113.24 TRINITY_DN719_c0_g10_i1:178-1503(-)